MDLLLRRECGARGGAERGRGHSAVEARVRGGVRARDDEIDGCDIGGDQREGGMGSTALSCASHLQYSNQIHRL